MSSISNRERLLRVLRQEPVDRIPVSPFIYVNYVKEFFGTHDVDWVVKTPEVYRHFGFDIIHRNCSIAYDAYGSEADNWQIGIDVVRDGRDETTHTTITTPQGEIEIKEALRWVYEYDAEVSSVEYPIKDEEDFELFLNYQSPLEPADARDIKRASETLGDDGIVAPWIQGAFNLLAIYYRKLDELLIDAVVKPEFYSRMIWPYEKKLIDFIQRQNVAVLFHNCGYAKNFFPLYSQLGMRTYESLTPQPYGDTILAEAVKAFGEKTTLAGGVDQLDLLRKGSTADIDSTVEAICKTVRNRCYFILGTTDYFNESTPRANIHALAEAGRCHGSL